MVIKTEAKPKTDPEDMHTINISGPAADNLISPITFVIRTDGDVVQFYNATPKPSSWQNNTELECSIIIADNQSGVDKNTIEFMISTDNGMIWSDWQKPKVTVLDNPSIVQCYKTLFFNEGEFNLIKWRAKDNVRDQFSISDIYVIRIDTNPLTFKNPLPKIGEFQYSTEVACSVEIVDIDSGVNARSIQFSILRDSNTVWSDWADASLNSYENKKTITVQQTINFDYGENNYIKWRAKDVARNGYFVSSAFQLKITHKIPKIHLYSPISGSLINTTQPVFQWNNSYVVLQQVNYLLEYWSESEPNNVVNVTETHLSYIPPKPLKFNTKYFWRVTPNADGEAGISESGTWNFTIDTLSNIYPEFKFDVMITPEESFQMHPEKNVEFEYILYNNGNRDDVFQVNFVTEPVWDDNIEYTKNVSVPINGSTVEKVVITFPSSGWEYKNYVLRMKITSNGALEFNQTLTETKTINVKIVKKPEETGLPLWFFAIIIIVIIILVIWGVIFYNLRKKARYKEFEYKPSKKNKDEVEIVYTPEHKKAVDLVSKEDLKLKPKK
jgi:hypothetical protein